VNVGRSKQKKHEDQQFAGGEFYHGHAKRIDVEFGGGELKTARSAGILITARNAL
jgi:hypothetical protein